MDCMYYESLECVTEQLLDELECQTVSSAQQISIFGNCDNVLHACGSQTSEGDVVCV